MFLWPKPPELYRPRKGGYLRLFYLVWLYLGENLQPLLCNRRRQDYIPSQFSLRVRLHQTKRRKEVSNSNISTSIIITYRSQLTALTHRRQSRDFSQLRRLSLCSRNQKEQASSSHTVRKFWRDLHTIYTDRQVDIDHSVRLCQKSLLRSRQASLLPLDWPLNMRSERSKILRSTRQLWQQFSK